MEPQLSRADNRMWNFLANAQPGLQVGLCRAEKQRLRLVPENLRLGSLGDVALQSAVFLACFSLCFRRCASSGTESSPASTPSRRHSHLKADRWSPPISRMTKSDMSPCAPLSQSLHLPVHKSSLSEPRLPQRNSRVFDRIRFGSPSRSTAISPAFAAASARTSTGQCCPLAQPQRIQR